MTDSIDYTATTPRFSLNSPQSFKDGIDYLNEHGYAVISDVLNDDDINESKALLWKFIETTTDGSVQRDDPKTWSNNWPSFSSHGVISGHGVGQSDFLWKIRSNPQVKKVFRTIWNDDALLVSFDGCGIFRDWRYDSTWKTSGGWNHVDQNPVAKPNRCCIQGLVSLTDQSDKTGGLIVYPKTYERFTELADLPSKYQDFVKVPDTHPIMNNGQTKGKLVHCQAGDIVLWDSRTVHCNTPATNIGERDVNAPVDLLRIVAYVSMSPVAQVPESRLEEFREKRKEMVENNCTLSHWSTELVVGGGKNTDLPKLSLDQFNNYQKALIFGYPSHPVQA